MSDQPQPRKDIFDTSRLSSTLRSLLGPVFHAEPTVSIYRDGSALVSFGERTVFLNSAATDYILKEPS